MAVLGVTPAVAGIERRQCVFRRLLVLDRVRLTSLLIATFLVALFPVCFYGALTRAAAASTQAPSNGNTNEEHREEHRGEHEKKVEATVRATPPTPHRHELELRIQIVPSTRFSSIVSLHVPHPSRYTERRLI